MKRSKPSAWAKQQGIACRTAWNGYKAGKLPTPAHQTATGTLLVKAAEEAAAEGVRAALYARVCNHDQKPQLDGQMARCLAFANGAGLSVGQFPSLAARWLAGQREDRADLLWDERGRGCCGGSAHR